MANRDEGEVTIRITADASDFSADLERELPRALVSAERKAEQAAKPERQRSMVNWQTVLTAGLGGAAFAAGNGAIKIITGIFRTGFSMITSVAQKAGSMVFNALSKPITEGLSRYQAIDQATSKLKGLGHSAEEITTIMQSATDAVTGTAFGLGDAATLAAGAVASGIKPGEELTRQLKVMADTATIAGTPLIEMQDIFGDVNSAGKATGETFMRLQTRGIPATQMLADSLGISMAEASEHIANGQVDVETFTTFLEESFGGAALASADTFAGSMENLNAALGRLGEKIMGPALKELPNLLKSFQGNLDKLGPSAKSVGEALGEGFAKLIEKFTPELDALVTNITDKLVENTPKIEEFIGKIVDKIANIDLDKVKQSLSEYWDKMVAVVNWVKENTGKVIDFAQAFSGLSVALLLARGAMIAFTAASAVNPWVLLGASVLALAGGLALLYQKSQPVKDTMDKIGEAFKPMIDELIPKFQELWDDLQPKFKEFADKVGPVAEEELPKLGDALAELGKIYAEYLAWWLPKLIDALTFVLPPALRFVTWSVQRFADTLNFLGGALAWVKRAFDDGKQALSDYASFMSGVLTAPFAVLTSLLTAPFRMREALTGVSDELGGWWDSSIQPVLDSIGSGIANFFTGIAGTIGGFVSDVVGRVASILAGLFGPVIEAIGGVVSWFGQMFLALGQAFWNFIFGVANTLAGWWDAIVAKIHEVWDGIKLWLSEKLFGIAADVGMWIFGVWATLTGWWDAIVAKVQEVWEGIKNWITLKWEEIKTNVANALMAVAFNLWSVWENIKTTVSDAWNAVKTTITDAIEGARENLGVALFKIQMLFTGAVGAIGRIWDRVTEVVKAPILGMFRWINDNMIGPLNNVIRTFSGPEIPELPREFADGGYVRGPGGPRDDKIPARLSNGEFVVNAASTSRFGPLLEAINAARMGYGIGGASVEAQILGWLRSQGMSDAGIAGILGNLQAESAMNPAAVEGGTGEGYGLLQWSFSRKADLLAFANSRGTSWQDLGTQLSFLATELATYPQMWSQLLSATNPVAASQLFSNTFVRPGIYGARDDYASAFYNAMQSGSLNPDSGESLFDKVMGVGQALVRTGIDAVINPALSALQDRFGGKWATDFILAATRKAVESIRAWADQKDAASGALTVAGAGYDGPGSGALARPLAGYTVTSEFMGDGRPDHMGIDLGAAMGTPVLAAAAGKIMMSGWNGGYGNYIKIDHGAGLATAYGHMQSLAAQAGQIIGQRAVIGAVGSTGDSTGPHLHFEVLQNGSYVNPRSMVQFDRGGLLQPGWSAVYNGTGKPEAVFNDKQMKQMSRGNVINITNYYPQAEPTSVTTARALRTLSAVGGM